MAISTCLIAHWGTNFLGTSNRPSCSFPLQALKTQGLLRPVLLWGGGHELGEGAPWARHKLRLEGGSRADQSTMEISMDRLGGGG